MALTFTGRITQQSQFDTYYFHMPTGNELTITSSLTDAHPGSFELYVGLYPIDSTQLLALTGPNENLFANIPTGDYKLLASGTGTGGYQLSVPSPATAIVPEPTGFVLAFICLLLLTLRVRRSLFGI